MVGDAFRLQILEDTNLSELVKEPFSYLFRKKEYLLMENILKQNPIGIIKQDLQRIG